AYTPPAPVRLSAAESRADPFPILWAVVGEDLPEPTDADLQAPNPEPPPRNLGRFASPGWLARIARRFRRHARESVEEHEGHSVPDAPTPRATPKERVQRKLESTDAMLHGRARAARRHELEARLLGDFPRLGPEDRAARWAELAAVYGAIGKPHDAA